ncbi:transcriptional regulator [Arsukibacterium sp. MJ3]|uniref:helix-turn-helix transcriptional regulator n=1 Tax=Arsukibacterium sp. MJ3 TaxID=1632859 RepID=UPI00062703AF|nr:WYL domain-containing protein [Arsukibacterium sp. MJ3]KKO47739.1 transcriptional regulator [Arsukibacterium sp. MJ3]
MSSAKSHVTLSRQWELLNLLPTRGEGKTAAQLKASLDNHGFKVTKRTVERDLNDLSMVFPIVSDDSKTAHLWRWMENKDIQLPGITVADAMILQLVEGTLKSILPQVMLQSLNSRFSQAKNKLQALEDSNSNSRLADKIAVVSPALPMIPPATSPALYEAVQQALSQNKQLQATYTALYDQQQKQYFLNPLGLVQRGHITYLVATIGSYQDVRLFALHRFVELAITENTLHSPAGFTLPEYLQSGALQFANGEQITLQARVSPYLSQLLQEAPLSEDMRLSPETEGWHRLNATVHDGWQLQWWILSHSSSIEVLAPASLRQSIINSLHKSCAHYPELSGNHLQSNNAP